MYSILYITPLNCCNLTASPGHPPYNVDANKELLLKLLYLR
jgi:hypothetical protein